MAAENTDNQKGLTSELEEPRRTTEGQDFGGYKGVSEEEPPHHKLHSDDEPLPKPAPGAYDEEAEEQAKPTPGAYDEEAEGQAKPAPGAYDEAEQVEPAPGAYEQVTPNPVEGATKFNESAVESTPRSSGTEEGGYTDPSAAFAGAPVDRKMEQPGYGYDQKTSEPVMESTPTSETAGTPKKEGLMTKIKEKLPGHHAKPTAESNTTAVEPEGAPKKGLMAKIKEKMPGHHGTTTGAA